VPKGKTKIAYDQDESSTPVCQLTTPTLKISPMTKEVLDTGRGFAGNLAIGREPIPTDRPNYQRTEGGFEEFNVSDELE
jgi:hypothetical protein